MTMFATPLTEPLVSGRYAIFHGGRESGEERWQVMRTPDGFVVTGEQLTYAPHPFPSRQEYRATLTPAWRLTGLEIVWTVGDRVVRSTHAAEGGMWRVRMEYGGQVREQEGDFPDYCEVEYGTHLFNAFILARRDFGVNGEHEFPVLRVGPPLMAVSPERMLYRCVERGVFETPLGPVQAKRYVVSLPPAPETEGYTFWADEEGFVLESYEGHDRSLPWMRLVEFRRAG
jgi:Putative glycolipid-binding